MSVLIFNRNFSDPNIVANASYSSQDSTYPASNVYNLERRRKSWRTSGHFEIVSGSNTLVFKETVGIDLTATIAAGDYAGDTAFFAAVKSALESAGDSTYTVSRDTVTKRIKITSNGSGGGGVFQLTLTHPSSSAIAGILGFSTASDLTGSLSYEADLLKIHTEEWLEWDLGIPSNPTGIMAVVDRNSVINISDSATIKIQGNWTNDWSSPAYEQDLELVDGVISYVNKDGFYTGGLRYWRFLIEDKSNPLGYIELGSIALSTHIQTTRGCAVYPLKNQMLDRSNIAFSDGGQTVVSQRAKYQKIYLDYAGLDKSSYESMWDMWEQYGLHTSFFICADPSEAFSTDFKKWVKLVKFDSEPESNLISIANWSMGIILREEL